MVNSREPLTKIPSQARRRSLYAPFPRMLRVNRSRPVWALVACSAIVVTLALSLAAVAAAHPASRPGKRAETRTYMAPAVAVMPMHPTGAAVCNSGGLVDGNRGCVEFVVVNAKERFVKVEVNDASGLPAPAFLAWGDDPREWTPFCGTTRKALRVRGYRLTIWLYPYSPVNVPRCSGLATTGSVTATFLEGR